MTTHDARSRKKQRSEYQQTQSQNDQVMAGTDQQPPLNITQPINVVTKGGPAGPSWSCRGCGRCNIHHTVALAGCWACMQISLNGPVFDADRWGDFMICQQMKAERAASASVK